METRVKSQRPRSWVCGSVPRVRSSVTPAPPVKAAEGLPAADPGSDPSQSRGECCPRTGAGKKPLLDLLSPQGVHAPQLWMGWCRCPAGRLRTCLLEHSALRPDLEANGWEPLIARGIGSFYTPPAAAAPLSWLERPQHSHAYNFPAPVASWFPWLLWLCAPSSGAPLLPLALSCRFVGLLPPGLLASPVLVLGPQHLSWKGPARPSSRLPPPTGPSVHCLCVCPTELSPPQATGPEAIPCLSLLLAALSEQSW